jgi:sec-independent protein translocase protein TatC
MADIAARRRVPLRPPSVDESRMSLAEHLIELRKRLLISLAAIAAGVVVGYLLYHQIYSVMTRPYCQLEESRPFGSTECSLFNTNILGEFSTRLRIAMVGGVILSGPIWLYQLWAFIAPGLHRRERRWGVWFISIAFLLFTFGAVFAYYTLDKGLAFLLNIGGERVTNLLAVDKYFSFITLMMLAFGISFLFPLALVLLNLAGVLSTARMRSSRRIVCFLIAVFAAVITPSQDPFTFAAMAAPMYVFYEAAIVFGRVRDRVRGRRELEDPNYGLADDEMSQIDDRPSEIDLTPSPIDDPEDDGPRHDA